MLGIPVCILLVLLTISLFKNSNKNTDIVQNLANNVGLSSDKPTNTSKIIENTYIDLVSQGVWKLSDNRSNPDNTSTNSNINNYDPSKGDTYVVIMDNHKLYYVNFDTNGNLLSNSGLEYTTYDKYITCKLSPIQLPENAYLNYNINKDNDLMVSVWQVNKAISDYSVYTKTKLDPREIIYPNQSTSDITTFESTPISSPVLTPESTLVPTLVPTPILTLEPTPVLTSVPTPIPTLESTPSLTPVPTPISTPVPTPVPTQDIVVIKEFPSPIFETEIPIYTVLLNNTWELVGFAHNPNK